MTPPAIGTPAAKITSMDVCRVAHYAGDSGTALCRSRPKNLAATGRRADGWIPGHLADWRSNQVAESRPIVDEAAAAAGRDPADVDTIYNVSGRIERDPLSETRDDEGRWIGGGVTQWVEELTFAVLERGADAFIYLVPPGESIEDKTVNLWAHEVAPAVRDALAKR
jgi:hypothetical protein